MPVFSHSWPGTRSPIVRKSMAVALVHREATPPPFLLPPHCFLPDNSAVNTGQGTYDGDYEPFTTEYATSPVIDASTLTNGELKFRRWLNVASSANSSPMRGKASPSRTS